MYACRILQIKYYYFKKIGNWKSQLTIHKNGTTTTTNQSQRQITPPPPTTIIQNGTGKQASDRYTSLTIEISPPNRNTKPTATPPAAAYVWAIIIILIQPYQFVHCHHWVVCTNSVSKYNIYDTLVPSNCPFPPVSMAMSHHPSPRQQATRSHHLHRRQSS